MSPKAPSRSAAEAHRARLVELRAETEQRLNQALVDYEELAETSGDVGASEDEGGGDLDVTAVERDRLRALASQCRDVLAEIEACEERVDAGTWATCVRCEGPIGEARLEALPTATVCVTCKARSPLA